MKMKRKCSHCKAALIIEENSMYFPEEKTTVSVHCPICTSKIYEGKTDGWFFVQTVENYKKQLSIKPVIYPMP